MDACVCMCMHVYARIHICVFVVCSSCAGTVLASGALLVAKRKTSLPAMTRAEQGEGEWAYISVIGRSSGSLGLRDLKDATPPLTTVRPRLRSWSPCGIFRLRPPCLGNHEPKGVKQ